MSSAFVFENETLLCERTLTGWSPLLVTLPVLDDDTPLLPYELGRVQLQASLAFNQQSSFEVTAILDNAHSSANQDVVPTLSAISCHYAQSQHLALPKIISLDAIDSNDNAAINAFIPYRQLLSTLSIAIADQLSQAIQLLRWQTDTQFCSRCSAPVTAAVSGERAMVCSVCRFRQYPRVQPCVITAITRPNPDTGETQILLAHHHRYGQTVLPLQYGLIAGFVEVGESLEHAVMREVNEEVGIELTDIRYVSSQPWPFPSNLMLGFRATYQSGDIVLQEDELSHADFFDLSDLPKIPFKGSIAYDLIAQIADEQGVAI